MAGSLGTERAGRWQAAASKNSAQASCKAHKGAVGALLKTGGGAMRRDPCTMADSLGAEWEGCRAALKNSTGASHEVYTDALEALLEADLGLRRRMAGAVGRT